MLSHRNLITVTGRAAPHQYPSLFSLDQESHQTTPRHPFSADASVYILLIFVTSPFFFVFFFFVFFAVFFSSFSSFSFFFVFFFVFFFFYFFFV